MPNDRTGVVRTSIPHANLPSDGIRGEDTGHNLTAKGEVVHMLEFVLWHEFFYQVSVFPNLGQRGSVFFVCKEV